MLEHANALSVELKTLFGDSVVTVDWLDADKTGAAIASNDPSVKLLKSCL